VLQFNLIRYKLINSTKTKINLKPIIMKQSNYNSNQAKIIEYHKKITLLSLVLIVSLFFSCSNEGLNPYQSEEANATFKKDGANSWEMELERLTKKTRRFHNFNVALAQGWDTDVTGYVPHMGHHYVNASLMDDTFDLENPEALLYVPDADGKMQFVGVEYLVPMDSLDDPSTPPDGFTGDEDEWMIVGPFWTLHAWVGQENPDGVFAPFNPLVD